MRAKKCSGLTQTTMRGLLFLLVSLVSVFQVVSAADYYWAAHSTATKYGSPSAFCNAQMQTLSQYAGFEWRLETIQTYPGRTYRQCKFAQFSISDNRRVGEQGQFAYLFGDSCPAGSTWNATAGSCDAPQPDPCESKAGQTSYHEHQVGTLDNPDAPHTPPPGAVCENKCQLAFSGSAPTDCYRYADGTKLNAAFCKYQYKYNGISCTDADTSTPDIFDQPPTKPPIDQKPLLTNATNCNDWVTNADGSRTRNCTANETFKQPGTMNCSTSGAALKCTAGTPPPAYSDKDTTQKTTEKANADGSTSTTTTTTTDKTTCYGTKPCESTSKTETDTGGTKPDGTPSDSSHTCTGDNCTKDDSDQDPSKDPAEEEEEGSSVSGEGACPPSITCSGDAVQCAILRSQKEQECAIKEFQDIDQGELESGVHSDLSGPDFEKGDVDSISFDSVLDTSSTIGGSCPALPEIVVTLAGQSKSMDFDAGLSELCRYASLFSFLLVAFAMWRGAEIVAGGMK